MNEGIDVTSRVEFHGYSLVPTWTGFVGDSLAYVSFFFTRPHRGELPTLVIKKEGEKNARTEFFSAFENEFEELWRHTVSKGAVSLFKLQL